MFLSKVASFYNCTYEKLPLPVIVQIDYVLVGNRTTFARVTIHNYRWFDDLHIVPLYHSRNIEWGNGGVCKYPTNCSRHTQHVIRIQVVAVELSVVAYASPLVVEVAYQLLIGEITKSVIHRSDCTIIMCVSNEMLFDLVLN